MPVNYINLRDQIKSMGEDARSRQGQLHEALLRCREALSREAENLIDLQRLVEQALAQNKALRCAVPVSEPLTTHLPAGLPAPDCILLAADGSQITPDPHDSVLYGLVNVGVFRMQTGSGKAPDQFTTSTLLYGDSLQTESGLASEDLVGLLRDVRERQILAKMAQQETAPVVTLTDGPLELFGEPRLKSDREFGQYMAALQDLALAGVITAGYISRPRAALLVTLLGLREDGGTGRGADRAFLGISDIMLLADLLAPGERSAIFQLQSMSSNKYEGRTALHFFYLNVGSASRPAFARVEIPLWVVEDAQAVALLQSVLVEQSRQIGAVPYPYPLLRAHEIAVVKLPEKQELSRMIQAELLRQGLPLEQKSEKQFHKDILGTTRKTK